MSLLVVVCCSRWSEQICRAAAAFCAPPNRIIQQRLVRIAVRRFALHRQIHSRIHSPLQHTFCADKRRLVWPADALPTGLVFAVLWMHSAVYHATALNTRLYSPFRQATRLIPYHPIASRKKAERLYRTTSNAALCNTESVLLLYTLRLIEQTARRDPQRAPPVETAMKRTAPYSKHFSQRG